MPITCESCGEMSADGKRFCADCGATLGPVDRHRVRALDARIKAQVDKELAGRLSEQKFVVVDTAQAVVQRLTDWAKLFAFVVGIPVALLLVVLAVFGIRTYSQFTDQVDKAEKTVSSMIDQNTRRVDLLRIGGDSLEVRFSQLQSRYARLDTLDKAITQLATRVAAVEQVAFTPARELTPALKRRVEQTLAAFQAYWAELGYKPAGRGVVVSIRPRTLCIACYMADTLIIDAAVAEDSGLILREYTHHVLMALRRRPPSGLEAVAIESGLAFYFPCSFTGRSTLGDEAFRRMANRSAGAGARTNYDIDHSRPIVPATDMARSFEYGELWGGAFWELRAKLDKRHADRILYAAWETFAGAPPQGRAVQAFVGQVIAADSALFGGANVTVIREVFRRRGVVL